MRKKTCKDCRYSRRIMPAQNEIDGHCVRFPPQAIGPVSSVFPPVHRLDFRCAEFKRKNLWQRLFGVR